MSIENRGHVEHAEHKTPIKTPKQLAFTVIAAFIVPILVIGLLAGYFGNSKRSGAGSDAMSAQAIENRIRPVAGFAMAAAGGGAGGTLKTGEEAFKAQCAACHESGAMGAPKVGDKGAWGARIGKGYDTLLTHALKGFNAMPAQAGGALSDAEVGRAVVYLANAGGANFKEAAAPAAAGGTEAGAQKVAADGKGLYTAVCAACHTTGAAGAPKFGDKAAWAPRIKEGVPHLVETAIKGKGAMPAKGGKADATEADIRAAVEYMVNAAK